MNISSRSTDPLLAALTNPTELAVRKGNLARSYPVVNKNGRVWPDSEAAYKAFKTGDTPRDERLMARIVAAKLVQHPELLEGIRDRSGAHGAGWTPGLHFKRALARAFEYQLETGYTDIPTLLRAATG